MNLSIVGISVAKSSTTYPQRDGGKSVACVTAAVPVGNVTLDVTVYARMDVKGEVSFDVSLPRKGVSIEPATESAIKLAADEAIGSWSGWAGAAERAVAILTAPTAAKVGKAASKLTFAPKPEAAPAKPAGK